MTLHDSLYDDEHLFVRVSYYDHIDRRSDDTDSDLIV